MATRAAGRPGRPVGLAIPGKFVSQFRLVHQFVYNKWYFDELYHAIFVKPAFWLGRQFWVRGDQGTIDRFGPNGVAWAIQQGALVALATLRLR